MNFHRKILLFFILLLQSSIHASQDLADHHVIFYLQKTPKNQKQRDRCNQLIHEATHAIKKACKLKCNAIDTNDYYEHRRDTVFFVHFNPRFNQWTLYRPSCISYEDFVQLAQKIYKQHGLQVTCTHDSMVTVTHDISLSSNDYLTLAEFEQYKKMSDDEFVAQIDALKNQQSLKKDDDNSDDTAEEIQHLEKKRAMKKFFFWHLQIPTTGLMPGGVFDIDDEYKPIAWHFNLWDVAPKKGKGAHVAIIDTGVSAFNVQDKEFSSIYKKNINVTAPDILQDYGYNLVSQNGLDPIRQIAINFGNYCDHVKFNSDELMQLLPEFIIDFIKNKNKIQIEQYLIKHAKKEYLDKKMQALNKKGEEALNNLLHGKYGIDPSGKDSFFHVVRLAEPYNEEALLETLPTPKMTPGGFAAGHGTFTQGMVNAQLNEGRGIFGLAPQAQVTMIKAFNDKGTTNKTTLQAALQRAITLKNPIVSMSLKITDEIDKVADAPLKELIDSIDYVVAASGNDGTTLQKEAYPAKFDSVAFDVGAFQYDDGNYSVCKFTQKEMNIGPKFVTPGFNIFSSGLVPGQTEDSMYLFMMGTSIAVPVITGFMALVLAEFQHDFTREQILKVIYRCSMKLADDDVWKNYIKLGTPDMRSALLSLHVVKALKQTLQNDAHYHFAMHFDQLVQAVHTVNYYIPSLYGQKIGVSFTNNFSQFCKVIQEKEPVRLQDCEFLQPALHSVTDCIDAITHYIAHVINPQKYSKKGLKDNKDLTTQLHTILFAKKFDLFAQASPSAKNRIKGALAIKKACMVD